MRLGWRTLVVFGGQSWKQLSRLNAASCTNMLVCTRLLTLNYMSIFLLKWLKATIITKV